VSMQTVQSRGEVFSQIEISIPIRRIGLYYIWKFFSVSVLMVIMSWFTFTLDPLLLQFKLAIVITLFLATVTLMFTLNQGLPKVPYLTLADKVVVGAFVFLFLAALENFVVYNLSYYEFADLTWCRRIDLGAQIVFPIGFVAFLLFLARPVLRGKSDHKYPSHQAVFFRGRVNGCPKTDIKKDLVKGFMEKVRDTIRFHTS